MYAWGEMEKKKYYIIDVKIINSFSFTIDRTIDVANKNSIPPWVKRLCLSQTTRRFHWISKTPFKINKNKKNIALIT